VSDELTEHFVLVLVLENWDGVDSVDRFSGRAFVAEGRNDISLAIYCQECVQDRARPVGNGLSWSTRAFTLKVVEGSFRPNHTVPYGAVSFLETFQAVNCLATFI